MTNTRTSATTTLMAQDIEQKLGAHRTDSSGRLVRDLLAVDLADHSRPRGPRRRGDEKDSIISSRAVDRRVRQAPR